MYEVTEALAITANTGVSIWLCQMLHTLKIFIPCLSDAMSKINEAGRALTRWFWALFPCFPQDIQLIISQNFRIVLISWEALWLFQEHIPAQLSLLGSSQEREKLSKHFRSRTRRRARGARSCWEWFCHLSASQKPSRQLSSCGVALNTSSFQCFPSERIPPHPAEPRQHSQSFAKNRALRKTPVVLIGSISWARASTARTCSFQVSCKEKNPRNN